MLPWVFALLAGAALPRPSPPAAAQYIARAWGTNEGLPQNSVMSIVQTRDGYLWLATFGGLVRFDGQSFTVFGPDNAPGLASARVDGLREDRRGVLWIATENGLSKYEAGRFTTFSARDGLPAGEIGAGMFDDRQGRLWMTANNHIVGFDGHRFSPLLIDGVAASGYPLVEAPEGDVLFETVATAAPQPAPNRSPFVRTVVRLHPGGALSMFTIDGDIGPTLVDTKGRLWITGLALRQLDPTRSGRLVDVPLPDSPDVYGSITALADDHAGGIWVGTRKHGVYHWHDGAAENYYAEDGLAGDPVRSLLVDRDDNVWIGTDVNGLHRLKRRRVFSYVHPGPWGGSIGPIVGDGADGLWVGGTCGGLLHFRNGAFEAFDGQKEFANDCVWALMRDPDGTLWIGSRGLGRLSAGHSERYLRLDASRDSVTSIARSRDGTLWVGTAEGLSQFKDGRFTDVEGPDAPRQRILCITEDRRGALWIGTVTGLYRFEGGRFTHYTKAEGLSHDLVRAVYEDADGVLWIGTYGGGLNRLKDGRFTSYGLKDGLPDVAVSRIIEDARGNLWMSGNKGVYRVSRRQLNDFAEGRVSFITSVVYGTADGMVIEETNGGSPAGWRTSDGRLWFPTIKGLVGIEPDTSVPAPPPVLVERAVVRDTRLDPAAMPRLGPGRADVEFHYTAIDLSAAEKTRFRYRLDGYDPGWIDAGSRRIAYYTNIPPGSYHFAVMATDSDGAWTSASARVAFVVAPFWWQLRAVQALGLALLLSATGVAVRFVSLRRSRARVAELERERALERERSRIARDLHDDLGSRLTHIAILADSANVAPRIAAAARDAAQTMRELVWTVNAPNDTVESFASYFALFAEEHVVAAGIRCRILLPPDLPARPLAADARRHLYLACKEAVNNAVKHAHANEIRVSFAIETADLVVAIADDGRGLPAEIDPRGNGLKNYRERMDAARGTVAIESSPQRGTRVTFRVRL